MKSKQKFWIILFMLPSMCFFILIYFVPIATLFTSSFTNWNAYEPLKIIGFDNYIRIFTDDHAFQSAMINTVRWVAAAIIIHVPFGVIVALVLSKKPFGWRFVRSVSLLPGMIAAPALALVYLFIFNPGMGLINGFIRMLGFNNFKVNWFFDPSTAFFSITSMWVFYAGVIIIITLAELLSISPQIIESARIDGASGVQIDIFIKLPLIKNIIGTAMILGTTGALRMFEIIFLTTSGGPGFETTNLSLLIFQELTANHRYGYANALSVILLLLGIVCVVIITKIFRMGKTSFE